METDRDIDFNQTSLFKLILSNNLPHLKFGWASHIEKKELRKPTFEDFLVFLSLQRKIAMRCAELEDAVTIPAESSARAEQVLKTEDPSASPKSYAAAAASPSRMQQQWPIKPVMGLVVAPEEKGGERVERERRQGGPPPGPLGKQNHRFFQHEKEQVAADFQTAGADSATA